MHRIIRGLDSRDRFRKSRKGRNSRQRSPGKTLEFCEFGTSQPLREVKSHVLKMGKLRQGYLARSRLDQSLLDKGDCGIVGCYSPRGPRGMRPQEEGKPGRRAVRKMRQPKMLSHSAGDLGSAAPPPGWVELRARARIGRARLRAGRSRAHAVPRLAACSQARPGREGAGRAHVRLCGRSVGPAW